MHGGTWEILREMIRLRSVRRDKEFTLRSGAKSNLYLNLDPVLYERQGFYEAGTVLMNMLQKLLKGEKINAMGGPAEGAGQLSAAIMARFPLYSPLHTFMVRDGSKEHGLREHIVGNLLVNDRVLLVDDVVTTGGSLLRTKEFVKQLGGTVMGMLVLVDRGVPETFKETENLVAAYDMKDLGLEEEATLK